MTSIEAAVDCYRRGGVLLYPTSTLWGLGGDGRQTQVLDRIQRLKGRHEPQPLLVLVPSIDSVHQLATCIPKPARMLMAHSWPSDLTLLLPARQDIPSPLIGKEGLVGVRLPTHPTACALIEETQGWLVSTSANRSGEPPPSVLSDVPETIRQLVDCVVEAHPNPSGKPSTIVAVATDTDVRLIRAGSIDKATLETIVGQPISSS